MTTTTTELKLIKGTELTEAQKLALKFKGMTNPGFVKNHSFYFKSDGITPVDMYPVCHSLSHLPY